MKKELYLTLCALATTLPVAAQQRNFQTKVSHPQ